MKLSPSQLEVLHQLASCNEPLAYFKGGYWTIPSLGDLLKTHHTSTIWRTSIATVRSLEEKGLLKQTRNSSQYPLEQYPTLADRVLTAKGLATATGCNVPMAKLVDMVVEWTGEHPLVYSSFNILNPNQWQTLLETEARNLKGHFDLHDFIANTAALTTDDNHIFVKEGHDTDGLHELIHAAGLHPGKYESHFIVEGLTQAAAIDIARTGHLRVRDTYRDEVNFVLRQLVPMSGLPLRDLVGAYIDGGLVKIAHSIVDQHPWIFTNSKEWGGKPAELIYNALRKTRENDMPFPLIYVIDVLKL